MKIKALTIFLITDLVIAGTYGLILPIFPLYLMDNIKGSTLFTVALAQSIFLLSKINFSWIITGYMKHVDTTQRSLNGLLTGAIIISFIPALYLLSTDITMILLAQIILGLGLSFMQSAWKILSSEDFKKADWSKLQSSHQHTTVFVMAMTAALGGFTAYTYGYCSLMYLMTGIGLLGILLSASLKIIKK